LTQPDLLYQRELGHIIGSALDRPIQGQRELWSEMSSSPDLLVLKQHLKDIRDQYPDAFEYSHIGDSIFTNTVLNHLDLRNMHQRDLRSYREMRRGYVWYPTSGGKLLPAAAVTANLSARSFSMLPECPRTQWKSTLC